IAPRHRRATATMIGFGGVAVAVAGAFAFGRPQDEPCKQPVGIADVWNAQSKIELQTRFLGVNTPYANETWERVATSLDDYATRWAVTHREACRATRVDGHQSEAVMDLRM